MMDVIYYLMGKTWEEAAAAGMVVAVDEVTAVMNESHSIFLLASNTIGLRREIGSKKKKLKRRETQENIQKKEN